MGMVDWVVEEQFETVELFVVYEEFPNWKQYIYINAGLKDTRWVFLSSNQRELKLSWLSMVLVKQGRGKKLISFVGW